MALALGYANVNAMLREMTADQFNEWIAFYQLEPFGVLAEDVIQAHWKAIYVNAHKKQGKPTMKTEKFLCFRDRQKDASELFEGDEWELSEDAPEDGEDRNDTDNDESPYVINAEV